VGFFNQDSLDLAFPVWGFAYDAVMALGFAACNVSAAALTNSTALYRALMAVDFMGLSGHVHFDNTSGSRYLDGFAPMLTQFRFAANGSVLALATVGSSIGTSQNWTVDALLLDALPPEIVPADVDYNYLGNDMIVLGACEIASVLVLCMGCALWLGCNWHKRAVGQSQPEFVSLIIAGVALSSLGILGLMDDDNPDRAQIFSTPSVACNYFFCQYCACFTLAAVALCAKLYRLYSVFAPQRNDVDMRLGVPLRIVFACMLAYMVWDMFWIGVWQGVAPFVWQRSVTSVDNLGQPLASYGQCALPSSASSGLGAMVLVVLAMPLVFALVVSLWKNDVPEEMRQGSVPWGLMLLIQMYAIGIPVEVALSNTATGRFVVLSLIVLLSNLIVLATALIPIMVANSFPGARLPSDASSSGPGTFPLRPEEGLAIPRVRDRFIKFAHGRHIIENVYFLLDVDAFRAEGRDDAWRKRVALALLEIYIRADALMQINISSALRQNLETKIKAGDVNNATFDYAYAEICTLLTYNAWGQFCSEGGLHGFYTAEAAASTPAGQLRTHATGDSFSNKSPGIGRSPGAKKRVADGTTNSPQHKLVLI